MLSNENKQNANEKAATDGSSQDSASASRSPLPSISLPKGGGALRDIGEKFMVNAVTGTGSLTIPVPISPGRSGFGPTLSLSYDSGAGNGPFGFGWQIALPEITRKTDKGLPRYLDSEESDIFILSGAEDLIPVLDDMGQNRVRKPRMLHGTMYQITWYRPRIEGLFSRIERWTAVDTGISHWRSITRDNVTTLYGLDAQSCITDPTDATKIFSYLPCRTFDDKGNLVVYEYIAEDSRNVDTTVAREANRTPATRAVQRYLKRIYYGNVQPYLPDWSEAGTETPLPADWYFQIIFDYGDHSETAPTSVPDLAWPVRPDPFSRYRSTFEVRTYRRCARVLQFHNFPLEADVGTDCLIRSMDFVYSDQQTPADPSNPMYTFLTSITQHGYRRQQSGYLPASMPPLEFAYSPVQIQPDVLTLTGDAVANMPEGIGGANYRWVDLDGEGLSGILSDVEGAWTYKRNTSANNLLQPDGTNAARARFDPLQYVSTVPSRTALDANQRLMDLSADGRLDVVALSEPDAGYFERTEDGTWAPLERFAALPQLDWDDHNITFVDLTGDGLADVLLTEDGLFTLWTSCGAYGFQPPLQVRTPWDEERGPKVVLADGTETIFLADMAGDGLSDLVRVRNGEVAYWPNLGYGRFGTKITMDNAPRFTNEEHYDPPRVHLADIDGSGTADLLYVGDNGVTVCFNQSGNAWAQAQTIAVFPSDDPQSRVDVVDLLGTGTSCLTWSSPLPFAASSPLHYVDLMGGQKPHLLTMVRNNLGAETRIRYAPSTRFYLDDRQAGKPWITRIHFPVQVVERVDTYDYVSCNRFVTRYAYHHGFYDGVEREFRGFGSVDQWDTEEFATLTDSGTFPQATNVDVPFHVPPVWTRTWFHTGVYFGEARISKHLEREYYREGSPGDAIDGLTDAQLEAMSLDDTILPTTILLPDGSRVPYKLSGEEVREACRALRGSVLRQEIYALDGTGASDRPYSVSERNYTIETLQPQGPNRYAAFFTHARETIDFHYERKLFKVAGNTLADPHVPPSNAKEVADPRVTHAITLAVDPFGNVLQSVAVGYGRRYLDPSLTPADQTRQGTTLVTYTENSYTNAISENDAYRVPLPAESRTYELIQVKPDATQADVTNLFRFDEVQIKVHAASDGQHDIPYENINAVGVQAGQPYRRLIERMRTLYRPNDMGAAAGDPKTLLPLGKLESLALPGNSYKLAFTPGLLSQVYQRGHSALMPSPTNVLGSVGVDGGGYVDLDGDGHWWIPSGRIFYLPAPALPQQEKTQALQHFFLPRRFEDPFGNSTSVDYDNPHDLLVVKTVDAVTNTVAAANDYRVLQPTLLTDPNGNRTAVSFDVLGMVVGTAVMGKISENLGDPLGGFTADLTQQQIDDFYGADDPHTLAGALLGTATTRILYDVERFYSTSTATPNDLSKWEPVFTATVARETHVSDLSPNQQSKLQITFSYSDGFGREIQKKIQAEPGPVVDGGPTVNPRWVGSGWTIYNNKGKPVRQYEPFFSQLPTKGHRFEFGVKAGVSPILCYDPVERVVATIHPNHTYEKVVFDPWLQETWDVNDTVLQEDPKTDPDVGDFFQPLPSIDYLPAWYTQRANGGLGAQEQDAATKAAAHANTPPIAYFDTLGRTFLTIADNAAGGKYPTRIELDIEGNQRSVTDALGRKVMVYDYDMLSNRIHQAGMEAGERWMLNDVMGKVIRAWDSRGHTLRTVYDELRRPIEVHLSEDNGKSWVLVGRTTYGESQQNPEKQNLRGKVYQAYDQAGLVTSGNYDFKGNLLSSNRQLVDNSSRLYTKTVDWSTAVPLETQSYTSSTTFDALNRPVALTMPDASVIQHSYNEASLLEQVTVTVQGAPSTMFVSNIDYNAKGQRTLIEYGSGAGTQNRSGVSTQYTYDPLTFHLVHLLTRRNAATFPNDCPQSPPIGWPGCQVQNLSYTYDPIGNITHVRDDAQQTIYFSNKRVEPSADYTYDAIYRLIAATGREHLGQTHAPIPLSEDDGPRMGLAQPGDGQVMGIYSQQYTYDEAGNILSMGHQGTDPSNPGWTRTSIYTEQSQLEAGKFSNRLTSTQLGNGLVEAYTYDIHGNMTGMPHLSLLQWDYKDQLQTTSKQNVTNGGTPETTYYVYDASGQRVRKITESYAANGQTPTLSKERIYLGGFEIYRVYGTGSGGTVTPSLERETLHVMDDKQRIALVETRTRGSDNSPPQLTRYQFSNHLGSACLELDSQAQIISYEEYYPYGSTSYQAVRSQTEMPKRYRYTGKERDEENGLYYHGARYYACWLGRWTACDPKGIVDQINAYSYVSNHPTRFIDSSGGNKEKPPANYGDIKPHYKQGAAIRDASGKRISEHEHPGARINWKIQTTDPETGKSPYDTRAYRHSATVTIPEEMAREKTKLDMQLRDKLKQYRGTKTPEDLAEKAQPIESDVQRTIEARDKTIQMRMQQGQSTEALEKITDEKIIESTHLQGSELHHVGKQQRSPIAGASDQEIEAALSPLNQGGKGVNMQVPSTPVLEKPPSFKPGGGSVGAALFMVASLVVPQLIDRHAEQKQAWEDAKALDDLEQRGSVHAVSIGPERPERLQPGRQMMREGQKEDQRMWDWFLDLFRHPGFSPY